MWVLFAVITVLLWGTSETIFKSVSNEDNESVLKLLSYNGIVLGICSIIFWIVTKTEMSWNVILTYLPISVIFITSMFFAYKAMKNVKISIISPLQNSSCALTSILCVLLLKQSMSLIQLMAVVMIVICIVLLSINKSEVDKNNKEKSYKKYLWGLAFAFGYWLLDGIGSYLDDYTLDDNLSEEQLIIAFSLIYCFVGLICFSVLHFIKKEKVTLNLDNKKLIGTLIETAGQYTYIYTYAFGDAALASPFIASYSIVSLILSRIFLKEKLNKWQYVLIVFILTGMIILSWE